jgi:hypothetical protein
MKASSKYGSAYPGTAPGTPARGGHRLKTGKGPEATPLKMPNERDEAIDPAGGSALSATVAQAAKDVKRGLPDTDRGPEVNRTYQKQKT